MQLFNFSPSRGPHTSEGYIIHSINREFNFLCKGLVWTQEGDVSDIMLSRVTFNFTGKNLFTVLTFSEREFREGR